MNLSIGIVGLPNVGKSTLFNALLKKQIADVANYPFCTIKPNVGVVEVPDERLPILAKVVNTKKIVPAVVEFYDIAGLVKGASKGEGLGNQFLANIREVSAIVHVVRLFEDENVTHVNAQLDSKSDIETIETELILADMSTLEKQRLPKMNATKEEKFVHEVIGLLKDQLKQGVPARVVQLSEDQRKAISPLNLLTIKPVIFVFNVSEEQLMNLSETEKKISAIFSAQGGSAPGEQSGNKEPAFLAVCAKLENEVLGLSEEEQKEYLRQYHLEETGLNRLIKKAYETLGLISFLTAGEKEARAWTIKRGMLAPQAAGVIHTDFEKAFIKADVISFNDFINPKHLPTEVVGGLALPKPANWASEGGWARAREVGKVQTVGKDYAMKEGDIVEFKVGA